MKSTTFLASFLGVVFLINSSCPSAEKYGVVTDWAGHSKLNFAYGIAVDGNEAIYAIDKNDACVKKFNRKGVLLAVWGTPGSGTGQFTNPRDLTVDSAGNVYVADTENNRIQKFSGDGTFLLEWGGLGSTDGKLYMPIGISVGPGDIVYVADSFNHRIQKFDSNGFFLGKWSHSSGASWIPYGIEADGYGNVYVCSPSINQVVRFDTSGTEITEWGSSGTGNGEFQSPYAVSVDGYGRVYVADTSNNRIQVFLSDGIFISKFGSFGAADNQFSLPYGMAVDKDGAIIVSDAGHDLIKIFNSQFVFQYKFGNAGVSFGTFNQPRGMARDSAGNIYVVDTQNDRVQKFNSDGLFLTQWTVEYSSSTGIPLDIAVDAVNNVYVCDRILAKVLVYDSDGNYIDMINTSGVVSNIESVGYDPAGYIYVGGSTHLAKYDSSSLSSPVDLIPVGFSVKGIAVNSEGVVYMSDTSGGNVYTYSSVGGVSLFAEVNAPIGVAVDMADMVYVVDSSNGQIVIFDSLGNTVSHIAPDDKGLSPIDCVVGADGDVYVSDVYNHRVVMYRYIQSSVVTSGYEGNSAQFSAQVTSSDYEDISGYAWDFGDGSAIASAGLTAEHIYAMPGQYTVFFHVIGKDGQVDTASSVMNITSPAPVAVPGGPYFGIPSSPVVFNGAGSFDPAGRTITGYSWDMGDTASETGAAPSHTYTSLDTYTVQLQVKNDLNLSSLWMSTSVMIMDALLDLDNDGIPNGWEIAHGLRPDQSDDERDSDNDGLGNVSEYGSGTDPVDSDTDNDGMGDGWEVTHMINPLSDDSAGDPDCDGVSNYWESVYFSNPYKADTDNDGVDDYSEITAGTDPADPNSYLAVTMFEIFLEYLNCTVPLLAWSSEPGVVYTIWVKSASIGPDYVVLEDDYVSKGFETIYPDQGGGPNNVPHPLLETDSRMYKVTVKTP